MKEIDRAIERVQEALPFPDRMVHGRYACANIASTVLRHLPGGSRILDFGAGCCSKTAVLSLLGYRCSAADDLSDSWHMQPGNREAIILFAQRMGIDFRLSVGLPAYDADSFDLIMLTDVIEHLHDSPRMLLNNLLPVLKPNGLLLITVPNAVNIRKRLAVLLGRTNYQPFDTYFWSDRWRGHVREYTKHDLKQLSEAMGLRCCELRACDHMLEKVPLGALSTYKAVTAWASGWKDSWTLVAKKPAVWSPCLSSQSGANISPQLGATRALTLNRS